MIFSTILTKFDVFIECASFVHDKVKLFHQARNHNVTYFLSVAKDCFVKQITVRNPPKPTGPGKNEES